MHLLRSYTVSVYSFISITSSIKEEVHFETYEQKD